MKYYIYAIIIIVVFLLLLMRCAGIRAIEQFAPPTVRKETTSMINNNSVIQQATPTSWSFTPVQNFSGNVVLEYQLKDTNNNSTYTNTVSFTVSPIYKGLQSVSVDATPNPTAQPNWNYLNPNNATGYNVYTFTNNDLINMSNLVEDKFASTNTVVDVALNPDSASAGTLTFSDPTWSFLPTPGYLGPIIIDFTITNSGDPNYYATNNTSSLSLSFTFNVQNDTVNPVLIPVTITTNENATTIITQQELVANQGTNVPRVAWVASNLGFTGAPS